MTNKRIQKTKKKAAAKRAAKIVEPSKRVNKLAALAALSLGASPAPYVVPAGSVLVLRAVKADMSSRNNFVWPALGLAEAPDWSPEATCGRGLHGWKWGEGDVDCCNYWLDEGSKWLVVEVEAKSIVDLGQKVKFPRGIVVFCGARDDAAQWLHERAPRDVGVMFATVTGGDGAKVTGGDGAKVTGGNRATVTGGNRATVTGGDGAKVTGGDDAKVTGGNRATVTGGDGAKVTGGDDATVTGGNRATVTGGDFATVTGGNRATVTGGNGATIIIRWWDAGKERYRTAVAEIDKDGEYKPGAGYHVVDGKIVAVEVSK